ncbi:hypothetical protein, partial [Sphingobium sp. YR768]|uniref:hypothetical protein n=1 Tax=Sphingobium sp. YR768 TaxID=1884365 RepID=UPI001C42F0D0
SPIMTTIVRIHALQGKPQARHMGKSALQILGGACPPGFDHPNGGINNNQDELNLTANLSKKARPPQFYKEVRPIIHRLG